MKKILKTAAAALAGLLAFALAACTVGNGDPIDEIPSYYKDWEATVDTSVTAVWDFDKGDNYALLPTAPKTMFPSSDAIKPSEGKGASLFPTFFKGNYEPSASPKTIKAEAGSSVTLDNLGGAYYFTLILEKPSNIQVYGWGVSGAEPKRLIAIVSEDGKVCGKMNIGNTAAEKKSVVAKVKGAPAGKYKLYVNGARLAKIDVSALSTFTEEQPVINLELEKLSSFFEEDAFKNEETNKLGYVLRTNVLEISELPVPKAYTSNQDSFGATAEWSVIDVNGKDVAKIIETDKGKRLLPTASGQAIVRARVGRYVADFAIVVEGDVELAIEPAAKTTLKALTDTVQLNALNNGTKINEYVDWKSSDPKVATVTAGKVIALQAGTTNITVSYTLGRGEAQKKEFGVITVNANDSPVVTLLDTKDKNAKTKFPAQGTWGAYSELSTMFKDVLTVEDANVATCSVGNFVPGKDWNVKSVTSNVDDTQYPGILFVQTGSNANIDNNASLVTFDITITPKTDKMVKLTDMTASFRASKYKITKVEIKKDATVLASASSPATSSNSDKDWRDTRVNFDLPLEVNAETVLTVTLSYEEYKSAGDQFSIGNIKLFFEKES